jgi:hypothetical protein
VRLLIAKSFGRGCAPRSLRLDRLPLVRRCVEIDLGQIQIQISGVALVTLIGGRSALGCFDEAMPAFLAHGEDAPQRRS